MADLRLEDRLADERRALGTSTSSMRRFLSLSRSMRSRNSTTCGRIISDTMRTPPMNAGFTTLSAPARLSFSDAAMSTPLAMMRSDGLSCRAETQMNRLSLSSVSAATMPRARRMPARSSTSSSVASPTTVGSMLTDSSCSLLEARRVAIDGHQRPLGPHQLLDDVHAGGAGAADDDVVAQLIERSRHSSPRPRLGELALDEVGRQRRHEVGGDAEPRQQHTNGEGAPARHAPRCGSSPNPTVVMVMTVMYAHSPRSHA